MDKAMRKLFVTDLDGTILYHHREAHEDEVEVELSKGRNISVMDKKLHDIFKNNPEDILIISSRNVAQCRRIDFFNNFKVMMANNGATLIIDGEVDETWEFESRQMIDAETRKILNCLFEEMNRHVGKSVVYTNNMYVSYKGKDVAEINEFAEKIVGDKLEIFKDADKIDAVPKKLTKEASLKRYIERYKLKTDSIVSFGDSVQDAKLASIVDECHIDTDGRQDLGKIFAEIYEKEHSNK